MTKPILSNYLPTFGQQRKRAELENKKMKLISITPKKPPAPMLNARILIKSRPPYFGHGRFCICKDCREKRLAQTGSLKTGSGLIHNILEHE